VSIRDPHAVWDDDEQRWISDAEVAEVPFHRVHQPPSTSPGAPLTLWDSKLRRHCHSVTG